jgi:hypothetical protein
MASPHGTDSSRGWKEGISAPATLMRLAAGAGREAQERTSIVHEAVNTVAAHSSRTAANYSSLVVKGRAKATARIQ